MGRRVAIVGGGISGLALAERLLALGVEPVVLEAGDRAGGKVGSIRRNGFVLETGPNGFLDRAQPTLDLADHAGVLPELRPASAQASRRFLWLRGKLRQVPAGPGSFLRSDLLPPSAKLRMALEPFTPRPPAGGDESVASFARRHLGQRAARDLVSAMVLGIFGGDAEKLSLKASFPKVAAMEAEHRSLLLAMKRMGRGAMPSGSLTSCEGGLQTIVDGLARSLGSHLRTRASVTALERLRDGWKVKLEGGEFEVDAVVVAAPADVAATLLGPLEPRMGELCQAVPYVPVAVVHLAFPRDAVVHPLDGFGYLVPPHEARPVLGVLFISTAFPFRAPQGQALFTALVGGSLRPELCARSDAELIDLVQKELVETVGAAGAPTLTQVIRWEKAIPQYVVGHEDRLAELEERLVAHPRLFVGGNAWRGVGFNDCIAAAAPLAERVAGSLG